MITGDVWRNIRLCEIERRLSHSIIKRALKIINDLRIILNEMEGYKYNTKINKQKKHFPGSYNLDSVNFINKKDR